MLPACMIRLAGAVVVAAFALFSHASVVALSIDQSSPKALLRSFFASRGDVDEAEIRALLHATNPVEQKMLDSVVKIELARSRLRDAEQQKLGRVTTAPVASSLVIDPSTIEDLNSLEERITGDRATVSSAGMSMEFVRIDGKWKLPIASLVGPVDPASAETLDASTRAQVAVIDAVIEDVKAGRITSEDAVRQELSKRLADRLAEARNAATQSNPPATAPVSQPARGT